jgi:hypothetical protein
MRVASLRDTSVMRMHVAATLDHVGPDESIRGQRLAVNSRGTGGRSYQPQRDCRPAQCPEGRYSPRWPVDARSSGANLGARGEVSARLGRRRQPS